MADRKRKKGFRDRQLGTWADNPRLRALSDKRDEAPVLKWRVVFDGNNYKIEKMLVPAK